MVAIDLHNQLIQDWSAWDYSILKANDNKTESRIDGEETEEIAGTGVNLSTNRGRTSLPYDAAELV